MLLSRVGAIAKGAAIGGLTGGSLGRYAELQAQNDPALADALAGMGLGQDLVGSGLKLGAIAGGAYQGIKSGRGAEYSGRHSRAINTAYKALHQRRYKDQLKRAKQNFKESLIEAIMETVTRRSPYQIMMRRWGNPHDTSYEGATDAWKKMHTALTNKANQGNKAARNILQSKRSRNKRYIKVGTELRATKAVLDPSWRKVPKAAFKAEHRRQRQAVSGEISNAFNDLWTMDKEEKKLHDLGAMGSGSTTAVNFGDITRRKMHVKN
jgi:hypothetical protein